MLGFLLGPLLEGSFGRSLLISHRSFRTFVDRPAGGTLMAVIAAFLH